jgi:Zn-finger nucleic acid-binding protein
LKKIIKKKCGEHCSNPQCFKEQTTKLNSQPAQYEKKIDKDNSRKKSYKKKKKPYGETL